MLRGPINLAPSRAALLISAIFSAKLGCVFVTTGPEKSFPQPAFDLPPNFQPVQAISRANARLTENLMPRKWTFATHDESLIRQISGNVNVSALVAQVLASRGLTETDAIQSFMQPRLSNLHEPESLPGVDEAADRIVSALKAGRRITIYGDYDVDGVPSTSLLWHCLTARGRVARSQEHGVLQDREGEQWRRVGGFDLWTISGTCI